MKAADVMTRGVVTVTSNTSLCEVARLLVAHKISAAPVIDADRAVIGIVSEGDLMRDGAMDRDDRSSWWLEMVAEGDALSQDYLSHVRSAGLTAQDVMTRTVISVEETTSLDAIARLLHEHKIKRVPVLRGDTLVGIVSRADLVRTLAHQDEHRGR